jgi:hypothetical protein
MSQFGGVEARAMTCQADLIESRRPQMSIAAINKAPPGIAAAAAKN